MKQKSNTKRGLMYVGQNGEVASIRLEDTNNVVRFGMSAYETYFTLAQAETIAKKLLALVADAKEKGASE